MRNRIYDNQSEPCVCQFRPQNINNGDENEVRGHYIVEEAASVSFTDMLDGVAPKGQHHNNSCARERISIFSVSFQNFVSSCSSETVTVISCVSYLLV